ncbi:MAG: endonuclease I family protein, partial [Candidatus Sericytochromatia bacterium]
GPQAYEARALGQTQGIPAGYYKGLEKLSGQRLLKELQKVARRGHKDLGYDRARDIMFETIEDPDGDDRLDTIYTGFVIEGVNDRKTAYKQHVSTEHVWPQSMGAKGVAKNDMHHLYPSEVGANSTRNNLPLGDVSRVERELPNFGEGAPSKIGYASAIGFAGARMVFEPRDSRKGDLARAMLYFYTRYGAHSGRGRSDVVLTNFELEHDALVRWHVEDPVTPEEKVRNQAIFKAQGNRNPFVDHPEYVQKIGRFLPGKGEPTN